jgi:ribulose 1,5-bisphosphate synthetase/thiazole synthase
MTFVVECERKIPVSMKVDVIVAGGGVARLATAIASARNGANTVLIERLNALGGLGSMGMVAVWYYPSLYVDCFPYHGGQQDQRGHR